LPQAPAITNRKRASAMCAAGRGHNDGVQCGCCHTDRMKTNSSTRRFNMSELQAALDKLADTGEGAKQTKSLPPVSRGSKNHDVGKCRPCGYFNSPQGCADGALCNFCHKDHDSSKVLVNALYSLQAKLKRSTKVLASSPSSSAGASSATTPGSSSSDPSVCSSPARSQELSTGSTDSTNNSTTSGFRPPPGLEDPWSQSFPLLAAQAMYPAVSHGFRSAERVEARRPSHEQHAHKLKGASSMQSAQPMLNRTQFNFLRLSEIHLFGETLVL